MRQWIKCLIVMGLVALLSPALTGCVATEPTIKSPSMPVEPTATMTKGEGRIVHQKLQLTNKQVDGYIIPLGKANIVCVITDVGMAGCGAFDVMVLDSFDYPAVRMKSSSGNPIATVDDLLEGIVKEVNNTAAKLGIKVGMTGRQALDLL